VAGYPSPLRQEQSEAFILPVQSSVQLRLMLQLSVQAKAKFKMAK
jgi:hypothetical protein